MNLQGAIQEALLSMLCYDGPRGTEVAALVEPKDFDPVYREIATLALTYRSRHGKPPGEHTLDLFNTAKERDEEMEAAYDKLLASVESTAETINPDFVIERAATFVRHQRLKTGLGTALRELTKETDEGLVAAEAVLAKAMRATDPALRYGVEFGDDLEGTLAFLNDPVEAFATGIKEFDRFQLGPRPGTLHMLLAPYGKGKCIAAGERVSLSDGRWLPIEEVVAAGGMPMLSMDSTGRVVERRELQVHNNGRKECLQLQLKTGHELTLTKNHRVWTRQGWKKAGDLSTKDELYLPVQQCRRSGSMSHEEATVLGYLLADGCFLGTCVSFTKLDPDVRHDMEKSLRGSGSRMAWSKHGRGGYVVGDVWPCSHEASNPWRKKLKGWELLQKSSSEKHIPQDVFMSGESVIRSFLSALFTCDGSVSMSKGSSTPVVEYCSVSRLLVQQVAHLLLRFGVVGTTREKTVNGVPYWVWVVQSRDGVSRFIKEVGFRFSKAEKAASFMRDLPPLQQAPTRSIARKSEDSQGFWVGVKMIHYVGKRDTYDLGVQGTHNYIASDVLVHNSWWLIQLAHEARKRGQNVLYASLEMSEIDVCQRMVQRALGVPKRKVKETRWTRFIETTDPGDRGLRTKEVIVPHKWSLESDNGERRARRGLKLLHNQGRTLVCEFPTSSLTVEGLGNHLDILAERMKFIPQLVLVDYADLMKPTGDTKGWEASIDIGKGLRRIAQEHHVGMASVAQVTSEGLKAKRVDIEHTALARGNFGTFDTAITYSQTEAERERKLARLFVAKARMDADRFTVLISQNYETGRFSCDSIRMGANYLAEEKG